MKIFITGATGFIGTRLIKRLASTNHETYCLVRETSQIKALQESGARLVTGDVLDKKSISEGMKVCDWVVNLANLYSFWEPDKKAYSRINVEGTRNVLECALKNRVAKVVHISSAVAYGKPADCPFKENSPAGLVQFSEYARTKYVGDIIAWDLYRDKGLPLVMIYPGSALGPGDSKGTGRLIQNIIQRKMPARVCDSSKMTFVYVEDIADAIVKALEKEDNLGEKYLIGKYCLSSRELYTLICEIAKVPLPRLSLPNALASACSSILTVLSDVTKRPPLWGMSRDQIRTSREGIQFDGSKAERELGISYTPIQQAMAETIHFCQQQSISALT